MKKMRGTELDFRFASGFFEEKPRGESTITTSIRKDAISATS